MSASFLTLIADLALLELGRFVAHDCLVGVGGLEPGARLEWHLALHLREGRRIDSEVGRDAAALPLVRVEDGLHEHRRNPFDLGLGGDGIGDVLLHVTEARSALQHESRRFVRAALRGDEHLVAEVVDVLPERDLVALVESEEAREHPGGERDAEHREDAPRFLAQQVLVGDAGDIDHGFGPPADLK
jgi:hypothetical protein